MARLHSGCISFALPLALSCAPALAQSSLAIYGNLDIGIAKESGSPARMDRGYNNWIGLRGEENLGEGLSAIFNVQTRFNPDTGQQERPNTFWQGETTVGLKSASAGTLRLGRALSPLWHDVWAFEPWLNSGFNASLAAYQTGSYTSDGVQDAALGFANFSRFGNGVFYQSPTLAGLNVHVAAEVEKAAGAPGRAAGLALAYTRGGFATMGSWERNRAEDDIAFLGASYKLGPATLMGSLARHEPAAGARERTFVLAGTWALGSNTLRAGYGRNRDLDDDKLSLGLVHALSRRTNLYADLYRRDLASDTREGFALGVNHSF